MSKKSPELNKKSNFIKKLVVIVAILFVVGMNNTAFGQVNLSETDSKKMNNSINVKKVLYVASYSTKLDWSFRIKSGIESVFESRDNLQLKVINMNTMGMLPTDIDKKKQSGLKAKNLIDSWKPDVVIASDDNASKYLIVPYYKDSKLPFVFCGLNSDPSIYGFPTKNVTGVREIQLVDLLVKHLSPYAKGPRIGSIRGDTMTNRLEAEYFEKIIGKGFKTYFASSIAEWKKLFLQLQNEVDILVMGDLDAVTVNVENESEADVGGFMYENTKIPTGHWDAPYNSFSLITLAVMPEEQGELSAKIALEILDGKSPIDIPIVKNKKATIFLNMKLAKKLGVIFPMDLIDKAYLIPAD